MPTLDPHASIDLQLKSLFDAIDEGFCMIEVIEDADRTAIAYRSPNANEAFVQQTGLLDPIRHNARELTSVHEQLWLDTYDRQALSRVIAT